jgi:hypothetical protein
MRYGVWGVRYRVSGFGRPLLRSIVYCKTSLVLIPLSIVHCGSPPGPLSIVYCLLSQYPILNTNRPTPCRKNYRRRSEFRTGMCNLQ